MSTVASRWKTRLAARRRLLATAQVTVARAARRAGSVRGRHLLEEAVARRALRRRQVAEAERVLARHPDDVSGVSERGVALVAGFEGFRAYPYQDAVGVWTIGYGETRGVGPHTPPVTRAQAGVQLRARLNHDYLSPVLKVAAGIGLHLTQGQADALASLSYNLGPGIFALGRTMGDALRSKDGRRIADAFLVYDKAGGRALPGLTRRRRAERAIFLGG
jgi:lysozyme